MFIEWPSGQTQIVENHLRVGELWEGRMGAPDRAIESYRQALAVDDHCFDAMAYRTVSPNLTKKRWALPVSVNVSLLG